MRASRIWKQCVGFRRRRERLVSAIVLRPEHVYMYTDLIARAPCVAQRALRLLLSGSCSQLFANPKATAATSQQRV